MIASVPALLYVALNIALTGGALLTIRIFGFEFGQPAGSERRYIQVLIAGFGAMALFRSSLMVYRVGDRDISVGLASVLDIFRGALDRAVDRRQAARRAPIVEELMGGVSFLEARIPLPTITIALTQNLSNEAQTRILDRANILAASKLSDRARAIALGLALMNAVGEDVVRKAVGILKDEIAAKRDLMLAAEQVLLAKRRGDEEGLHGRGSPSGGGGDAAGGGGDAAGGDDAGDGQSNNS